MVGPAVDQLTTARPSVPSSLKKVQTHQNCIAVSSLDIESPSLITHHIHQDSSAPLSIIEYTETAKMVRKLKHHEQKLLKKTDFVTYKQVRSPKACTSMLTATAL